MTEERNPEETELAVIRNDSVKMSFLPALTGLSMCRGGHSLEATHTYTAILT
jgi:hypothetical protein